jgi:hypothetical protein
MHLPGGSATEDDDTVLKAVQDLPYPEVPSGMEFSRTDLLHYVRKNFENGMRQVAEAPAEKRELLMNAHATRFVA